MNEKTTATYKCVARGCVKLDEHLADRPPSLRPVGVPPPRCSACGSLLRFVCFGNDVAAGPMERVS